MICLMQTSAKKGKHNQVPADAVPLEAIKFEAGANIEAMDGYNWYKAKIIEVKISFFILTFLLTCYLLFFVRFT